MNYSRVGLSLSEIVVDLAQVDPVLLFRDFCQEVEDARRRGAP